MKISSKYLLALGILMNSSLYSQETLRISSEEAVRKGIEHNKNISIGLSKQKSAHAKVEESNAGGLPSLKFLGTYTRLSEVDAFKINGFSISPAINNNYNMKLSLTQPIFAGNRISSSIEMNEAFYDATGEDLENTKTTLASDIKNAYWSYYKAIKSQEALLNNITQVKAHLTDIQNFYNAGLSIENDVLKVKVQLSNLELSKIELENSIDIAAIGLCNLLGISLDTKIETTDNPEMIANDKLDASKAKELAIQARPDLKAMEQRIKAANKAIEIAKSGWFPQINFAANYTYANPNSRIMPSKEEFKGTWDLGLSLSYNIWDWRTTSLQTEQAEETLKQSEFSKSLMIDGLELEVKQSVLVYNRSFDKLAASKYALEQAKENLRVTNDKFKAGAAISSDLLDAENALLQSEINLINAQCDYQIALAKYNKAIGKI